MRKNSHEVPDNRQSFSARVLDGYYRDVNTPKQIKKVKKAEQLSKAKLNVGLAVPPLKLEPRNKVSGVYNRLKMQANSAITEPTTENEKVTYQKLKSGFTDLHGVEMSSNSLNDFNVSLHPEEELARRG